MIFVAVGVRMGIEVDVNEIGVDEEGTVVVCAFPKSVGTALALAVRAGVVSVDMWVED